MIHYQLDCVIANVYAHNDSVRRRNLWEVITNLKTLFLKPWCIRGDFNEVRAIDERNRCIRRDREMNEFNDFIDNLVMVDTPMLGRKYTWCNSQECDRWSRSDRFLSSPMWLEWFKFKLWGLPRLLSNHCQFF